MANIICRVIFASSATLPLKGGIPVYTIFVAFLDCMISCTLQLNFGLEISACIDVDSFRSPAETGVKTLYTVGLTGKFKV